MMLNTTALRGNDESMLPNEFIIYRELRITYASFNYWNKYKNSFADRLDKRGHDNDFYFSGKISKENNLSRHISP